MSNPSASPGWTGATGSPVRLMLARHGQTPLSVDRRYCGRVDAELTELGRTQAQRTAERLVRATPDLVLSSPLRRCRATATQVAEAAAVPLVIDDGLIETDFGQWDGLTFSEAAARDPEVHRAWLSDTSVAPPAGESFDTVRARVEATLIRVAADYPGWQIAVVSHVTPIKLALRYALDSGPGLLYRLHLDLASVSEMRLYPDGNASVHLVNDTSHLD